MTREQLEHVIRAAAEITGDAEIVVIGSTSILGQYPSAPLELLGSIVASREKDRAFNRAAIRHGFVQRDVLLDRLGAMDVDPALRQVLRGQIEADFAR